MISNSNKILLGGGGHNILPHNFDFFRLDMNILSFQFHAKEN